MGTATRLPVHYACELCGEPKRAFIHAVENRHEDMHDFIPHYKHTLVLDRSATARYQNTYVFVCIVDDTIFHVTKGSLWLPSHEEPVYLKHLPDGIWGSIFTTEERPNLSALMDEFFGPRADNQFFGPRANKFQWLDEDGKYPWEHG